MTNIESDYEGRVRLAVVAIGKAKTGSQKRRIARVLVTSAYEDGVKDGMEKLARLMHLANGKSEEARQ